MDVDFAQLRAFVAVADERHFGRAADELLITQQGLSKRIQRLEQILGQPLFVRNGRDVELTEPGERFLPSARRLLGELEVAVDGFRPAPASPLRIDVWGPRLLDILTETMPDLLLAATMRRSLSAAVRALQRAEIDAAIGRVHDLEPPLPTELDHRLVLLDRHALALGVDHPLAQKTAVTAADLTERVLWFPAARDGATELLGLFRRYAEHLGVPLYTDGHFPGLDADPTIDTVRQERTRLLLSSEHRNFGPATGLRQIPLQPTPCYPWAVIWRTGDRNPMLSALLERLGVVGDRHGWLRFDPDHDWLPDTDLKDLHGILDN